MAAIIQLLLDRYVLAAEALEPDAPASRDAISQLRFQTQALIQEIRLQTREKDDPTSSRADRIEETIEIIAQQLDDALARSDVQTVANGGGAAMRRLAFSTALVLATLAGIAILWELRGAVLIFFLSLGTSAALRPVIEQLHRWGLPNRWPWG